jgi:hypothetical protein
LVETNRRPIYFRVEKATPRSDGTIDFGENNLLLSGTVSALSLPLRSLIGFRVSEDIRLTNDPTNTLITFSDHFPCWSVLRGFTEIISDHFFWPESRQFVQSPIVMHKSHSYRPHFQVLTLKMRNQGSLIVEPVFRNSSRRVAVA